MEQRKRVIEKIKKLLNMSREATIHEKEIAIFQAQRLMAKFHIDEFEVHDLEKEKIVHAYCDINIKKRVWQMMADVIASNFRCKNYISIQSNTIHNPVFVGFETDATVCREIFESEYKFASFEAHNVASYYSYHYRSSKGVRDEWILGFIKGLKEGFVAQIESSSETAIMRVVPMEVKEEFGNITWSKKIYKDLEIRRNNDESINRAGYQNGYDFAHGRKQSALDQEDIINE